ncbi:hypothetical protein [Paenibacillus sp. PAMC21692]|uniref:hypothetical protein n=1 Tax=Paenibacillus sp. PAMC21692 TaxID=2762320 RepID=UPI00164D724A|nr:hypothetical protein [Paenibacillus sp. PAMC21692]QNK57330.1 hypothetical protein H7F31_33500 [Paenibacillus sp. PAMC21692]
MKRSKIRGKKALRTIISLQLIIGLCVGQLAAANELSFAQSINENGDQLQTNIKGELSAPLVNDQSVLQYLSSNKRSIGVSDPAKELTMKQKSIDSEGRTHYLYQLQVDGVPVYGKYIRIHLNKSKRVTEIRNELAEAPIPEIPKTLNPKLSSEDAIASLQAHLENALGFEFQLDDSIDGRPLANSPESTLMIYPFQGKSYLVYETELSFVAPKAGHWIA